jgi:ACS family tartrate transporter-like MFS transporter
MGFYALLIFTPQIIAGFKSTSGDKLTVLQVGLLTSIPSLVATLVSFFWARNSDRTGERVWHASAGTLIAVGGIALCLSTKAVVTLLVGLTLLQTGLLCALLPLWQLPTRGLSSSTAAVVIAAVNSAGVLGSFISPMTIGWLKERTGSYDAGLMFLAAAVFSAGAIIAYSGAVLEGRSSRARLA